MRPDPRFHACIIAGGSGERFWPMSRVSAPKHLLKIFSERTLLEQTVMRLKGVVPRRNIWILTNRAQVPHVRRALPGFPRNQIVAEPSRRDTAPAAALATGLVHARRSDGIVAILPADALIKDTRRFAQQLEQAFRWAAQESEGGPAHGLLTFAVTPTFPATGYGYLELGPELARGRHGSRLLKVKRFVEKPDLRTAKAYLAGGCHAWNAGIFVWSAKRFLAEVSRTQPRIAKFVRDFPRGDPARYLSRRFGSLPKISVDYAVLEKAAAVATVIAKFDWDDVGSWSALNKHFKADRSGNITLGEVAAIGTSNTIAVSNGRVIGLCGVRDLVVVETPDAVLVCHKDCVQDIKRLLPGLPRHLV
jgi:mannose-1-phosphate guanylyltransferase